MFFKSLLKISILSFPLLVVSCSKKNSPSSGGGTAEHGPNESTPGNKESQTNCLRGDLDEERLLELVFDLSKSWSRSSDVVRTMEMGKDKALLLGVLLEELLQKEKHTLVKTVLKNEKEALLALSVLLADESSGAPKSGLTKSAIKKFKNCEGKN